MSKAAEEHPPVTEYDPPPGLDAAIHAVPLVEAAKGPKRIGYLTNYSFHIWYQILIEVMKRRGSQYGAEIDVVDAGMSVENQIAQAREMVKRVDAIVLTPANTSGLEDILVIAGKANVPVVVEANPVSGMATMVAICDYDAGYDLGAWIGGNVKNADGTPLRILDVGLPWLRPCLL
ncbi:MAG: substrate-binding domain-containing protein, partial [Acidobacteriota bacterium]